MEFLGPKKWLLRWISSVPASSILLPALPEVLQVSIGDVSLGLRRLADAIDAGKVPESVCTINYGTEPAPNSVGQAMQKMRRDGSASITIVLRFTKWQDTLKEFVINKVLTGK